MKIIPLSVPFDATVDIPGSKSYTNRALIMASIAGGGRIEKPLLSDDTEAMMRCLEALGVRFRRDAFGIEVLNTFATKKEDVYELDADISGTTLRFLLPVVCAIPGTKLLFGKEGLNKRPIKDLVDGLRQIDARIEYTEKDGFPPLRVSSEGLQSAVIRMSGSVSSQYFSALLMMAPMIEGGLIIEVLDEQISKPYIDMTIDSMSQYGIRVVNEDYKRYVVAGGEPYEKKNYRVEGDVSSASYFAAIAALTKSKVTLTNMNPDSKQADMGFFKILEQMGARITYAKHSIVVEGDGVKPMDVDMEHCPDQAQTLAVLAAFADGTTHMSGVRSLRVKETERVKAVQSELLKMGIKTESTEDTLTIHGGNPKPASIQTYGDHRMAMSFAVAGTKLAGMEIQNPEVVGKTFPEFWAKLEALGATI